MLTLTTLHVGDVECFKKRLLLKKKHISILFFLYTYIYNSGDLQQKGFNI
jgi:hypothetical protein